MTENIDYPEEIVNQVLQVIEHARSSGKIRKGANEVTKSAERGEAKLIAYAKDVTPPEIVAHLPLLAEERGMPCVPVPKKDELGAAAGLPVSTTAVAVVNAGDGDKLLKNLIAAIESLKKPKKKETVEKKAEEPKKEEPKEKKEEPKPKKEAPKEEKKEEAPKEEPKKE